MNFVDCESFFESNSPGVLALCETNLGDSIGSGNFSVRGYLPLMREDFSAFYVKEGLPIALELPLENSADNYYVLDLRLTFFFLYQSHSSSLCTVFDSISSNMDEVFPISPFVNAFVFGDFNVNHRY